MLPTHLGARGWTGAEEPHDAEELLLLLLLWARRLRLRWWEVLRMREVRWMERPPRAPTPA
jgi:hypothetical protein